jgi:transcriptional regulator with XRE-family HTH domain
MNFSAAFDETISHFKLKAKDIASVSGLTESAISKFRRGEQDLKASSLERLIKALPQEAKQYLFLKILVGEMDSQGIAALLSAIAFRIKESDENSEDLRIQNSEPVLSLR